MSRMIYVITACFTLAVLPQLAFADWEVGRQKDEMTDKVTLFASVANKNAQLYLHEDWRNYVKTQKRRSPLSRLCRSSSRGLRSISTGT